MSNATQPAFPAEQRHSIDGHESVKFFTGMTKREYFTAMALQGLLAHPSTSGSSTEIVPMVTGVAIAIADQVLEALAGEQS